MTSFAVRTCGPDEQTTLDDTVHTIARQHADVGEQQPPCRKAATGVAGHHANGHGNSGPDRRRWSLKSIVKVVNHAQQIREANSVTGHKGFVGVGFHLIVPLACDGAGCVRHAPPVGGCTLSSLVLTVDNQFKVVHGGAPCGVASFDAHIQHHPDPVVNNKSSQAGKPAKTRKKGQL